MREKVNNLTKIEQSQIPKEKLPLNLASNYWKSLDKYNLNLRKNRKMINKPMLILWGEKDYQVREADFKLYKKHFSKKAKFIAYENLNHLFIPSAGEMSPEECLIPSNIPEYVIDDIHDWLIQEKPKN